MTDQTLAFVTKSYAPDRERCELLCRSIELLAPGTSHWIIVDSRDRAVFRGLENAYTRIVTTEELLPRRVRRIDLPAIGAGRNVWVGARLPPMRGWLVQQLAKLAVTLIAPEDMLVHADSDIVLIRRFRSAMLEDDTGALRLYRVPSAIHEGLPTHVHWHRTAEQLLGLPARALPLPDYIGGLIPWRRETAVSLLEHIEARSGRDWVRTLARSRDLSEYILFGRYVEDVLGSSSAQRPSDVSLCHCYWGSQPMTNAELETFVRDAGPEELAVMVSAKAGMRAAEYADVFERCWRVALQE